MSFIEQVGTRFSGIAAASTNATNVKATPGVVKGLVLSNNSAAVKFFKMYDKATAPTVGTDTPIYRFIVPANSSIEINTPLIFPTGIGFGTTGLVADADVTVLAANDLSWHGTYY